VARYCRLKEPPQLPAALLREEQEHVKALFGHKGNWRPIEIKKMIQDLMWGTVGPVRRDTNLNEGLAKLDEMEPRMGDFKIASFAEYNLEVLDAIEADFMLTAARLVMVSARIRQESRGAHTRLDFPQKSDENWLGNIVLKSEQGRIAWRFVPKKQVGA
jgi:succinate dehydrogenase / fumarate reductase flavoprotein subunit